ncbi:MAG: aminopeptidase [Clostridiaceae bacterium]|nr:aminopeptidase [Clostridiaceae bacterium]
MDKVDVEYIATLVKELNEITAPLVAGSDGRTSFAFACLAARTLALAHKNFPDELSDMAIEELTQFVRDEYAAVRSI